MSVTLLTSDQMLEILRVNLSFTGMFGQLNVWDGVSFKVCSRADSEGYICGHCHEGIVSADGDVCRSCFSLAVQVEHKSKIGETINIRRPRAFASINVTYGGDPDQPQAPATHTFVKC